MRRGIFTLILHILVFFSVNLCFHYLGDFQKEFLDPNEPYNFGILSVVICYLCALYQAYSLRRVLEYIDWYSRAVFYAGRKRFPMSEKKDICFDGFWVW